MDTIAFIGGGNMASAIIGGQIAGGHDPAALVVVEPDVAQRERLRSQFSVTAHAAADEGLVHAAVVVWAVKPQAFREAAAPCRPFVGEALHLSVMAGIRSDALAAATGTERIVRAMPNTPALIGMGIAGLYARPAATAGDRARVEQVLAPTGRALWVGRESDLDAVTALSGSGPAYVFYVVEAMAQAAVEMGLGADQGRELALATLAGAAELALRSGEPAEVLRARVTSKGGTTHAALTVLESRAVKQAFVDAIRAAQRRAEELGDEFG